ncbi:hypothetical protein N7499_008237 [Penicillium canescens]|nr:hypothetical protein N7499_008237 [Penicillium canescens]KAJ6158568.1 hypothetical protein N7485_011394 [Penicillium canescens]
MFSYEKFMKLSFPIFGDYYDSIIAPLDGIQRSRRLAIRFLAMNCSAKYGFPSEAHFASGDSKSVYQIPTPFDSALLLPLVQEEAIATDVVHTLQRVLLASRQDNGNWNALTREIDADSNTDLFPDDIDDTSIALMALYLTNRLTQKDLQNQAEKLLASAMRAEDGVFATWLHMGSDRRIVHERYLNVPKVCMGCLANFLWMLAEAGLEKRTETTSSIEFISKNLEALRSQEIGDTRVPSLSYYLNRFIVYFFLSRFIEKSEYGRARLGKEFEEIIYSELKDMASGKLATALNIAALILTTLTLRLHTSAAENKQEQVRKFCIVLMKALLEMQTQDGSFPRTIIYKWNSMGFYGGSQIIATAMSLHAIGRVEREILGGLE